MSETQPTSEQIRFRSSKTGEHILDTYLEAAEVGARQLSDLLGDLFNEDGTQKTDVQFRVTDQSELQYKIGENGEWTTASTFFRPRGAYANATAYAYLDLVSHSGSLYLADEAHTSASASPDPTKWMTLIDGTIFADYVSDAEAARDDAEQAADVARAYSGSVPYHFSQLTADVDPTNGIVRFNNSTYASVTQIFVDNNNADGVDVTAYVDTFDASSNTVTKGTLFINESAADRFAIFSVTGSVIDGSGYRKITVVHLASNGPITDGAMVGVAFSPAGNDASGSAGLGDVVGPATHAANYVPTWSGANTKTLAEGRAVGVGASTSLIDRASGDARYQPLATKLTNFAAVTGGANKLAYFTGADSQTTTDLTAFAITLLDDANAAAARTTLGLNNVDNTSDANKPVSTATQAAIDAEAAKIAALQRGEETPYTPTITAGALAINLSLVKSDVKVTVNGDVTALSFTNAPASGTLKSWTLRLLGDGTARTFDWSSSAAVKPNGGSYPTYNSTLGKTTTFVCFTDDGGAKIHVFKSGETG